MSRAPKILQRTKFGDPVLREVCRKLTESEIASSKIQNLIADMRHTLEMKKYGVGLASPQVGIPLALSVIGIKPTPSRPDSVPESLVIINPEVIETYGRKEQMWEGCISFGDVRDFPYAKVPRYQKIKVRFLDEHCVIHELTASGLLAHVLQHEIDHLNGILFVDKVKDTRSYMMISEYKKNVAKK